MPTTDETPLTVGRILASSQIRKRQKKQFLDAVGENFGPDVQTTVAAKLTGERPTHWDALGANQKAVIENLARTFGVDFPAD